MPYVIPKKIHRLEPEFCSNRGKGSKKVALILNDDFSTVHFRRGLIQALINHGSEVYVITPPGPYIPRIKELGATHIAVDMYRFMSPIRDFWLMVRLYRICRQHKFDVVHTMTIKPNIYGAIAARLAGASRVVSLVSGLGYAFMTVASWRKTIIMHAVTFMYRCACLLTDRTWFQNPDDLETFVTLRILPRRKALLIKGSGVNVDEYAPHAVEADHVEALRRELNCPISSPVVLSAVARVTWSKGIREFIEASFQIASKGLNAKFLLVGPLDPDSPDAVPESYLRHSESDTFQWVGFRNDIRDILALADIVVLASYYREGVPRILLEAMAMAKPIITTDSVGCRETIEHEKNGIMVPVRDADSVAEAVEVLLTNDSKRAAFGKRGRAKVESEFAEDLVVKRVFRELYRFSS